MPLNEEVMYHGQRFVTSGRANRGERFHSYMTKSFNPELDTLMRRVREERNLLADPDYFRRVAEFYARIAAGEAGIYIPLPGEERRLDAVPAGSGTRSMP